MKKSPLSAIVLVAVAGLTGAIAIWAMSDKDSIDGPSAEVRAPAIDAAPRVMELSPRQQRKQAQLEAKERELDRYREAGQVLANGVIRIKDVDGSPLYISPKIHQGVGKYGEPIYAMAKYKRRPAVPLRELKSSPKDYQPTMKRVKGSVLTLGDRPGADPTDTSASTSGGGGGKKQDAPKKPGQAQTTDADG